MCLVAMNLQGLFQDFNPSKCIVYSSLFLFLILFGLRLDEVIVWNFFIVFLPLWIWKSCVFMGATCGMMIWIRHPEYRGSNSIDLQAMFIATCFHLLLLFFEVMLCITLEIHALSYRVVFIPIYGMSALSIVACVWGYRNERRLEFESFFSLNILQFVCLSLKFDDVIDWSWEVVFVPIWIVLTLISIGVLYYIIWALLFMRATDITEAQRRQRWFNVVMFCFIIIPLLTFMVLLTRKLDGFSNAYYTTVFIPLKVTLACFVVTSFYQKGCNQWWFGLRRDFCEFLLDSLPFLREYGNVTFRCPDPDSSGDEHRSESDETAPEKTHGSVIVGTVLVIDMPD